MTCRCGAGVQGTWVLVPAISNSHWMVGSHFASRNHFICLHIVRSNVAACLVQPSQVETELLRPQAHLQGTWRGATALSLCLSRPLTLPKPCVFGSSSESPLSSQCPCCSKGGRVTDTGAPLTRGEYPHLSVRLGQSAESSQGRHPSSSGFHSETIVLIKAELSG